MFDLNRTDLVSRAAQASRAPDFNELARRARLRRRAAVLGAGLAAASVLAAVVFGSQALQLSSSDPIAPSNTTHQHTQQAPIQQARAWSSVGRCPITQLRSVPAGAGCATATRGDFDGDGSKDTFIVYAYPRFPARRASTWHAKLLLASGTEHTIRLPKQNWDEHLGVVTTIDSNRDGRDEALVLLQQGASNDFLGIVAMHGDRLQLTESGGAPFVFDNGGSVEFGSGASCREVDDRAQIVETGFGHLHGQWQWNKTVYEWHGTALDRIGHSSGTTTESGAQRYAGFTCYRVHLGVGTWPRTAYR